MGQRIAIFADGRALEGALLARLARRHEHTRGVDQRVPGPLRILVPTSRDRVELAARLVAGGRAHLGARIQSLEGLAQEILGGERPVHLLLDLLVPRLARRVEGELTELVALSERYDGGIAVVVDSVHDLLDAGLAAGHLEAGLELLAGPGLVRRRAREVFHLAAVVRDVLDQAGLVTRADLMRAAATRIGEEPRDLGEILCVGLPARRQGDGFLAALLSSGAQLLADFPGEPSVTSAWTGRATRLAGLGVEPVLQPVRPPELWFGRDHAVVLEAVADAVETQLEAGVAPERIVVAAGDESRARELVREFRGRGLPVSAPDFAASPDGIARRLAAIAELFESGVDTSVSIWLAALGRQRERALALACASVGLRRLGELAATDPASGLDELLGELSGLVVRSCPSPFAAVEPGPDADSWGGQDPWAEEGGDAVQGEEVPGPSSMVPRDELEGTIKLARVFVEALDQAAAASVGAVALARLRDVVCLLELAAALEHELEVVLAEIDAELPPGLELQRGELLGLVASAFRRRARRPLSVDGGGVRVLSLAAAAASTWDLAFLLDASAAALDGSGREDPLLPDALRRELQVLLPDLELAAGRPEETHELVLRLSGGARRVVWCWSSRDGAGGPSLPSAAWARWESRGATRRNVVALEQPLAAGLDALGHLLGDPRLARQRLAAARIVDSGGLEDGGQLWSRLGEVAPRHEELWATRLEAIARCPWQVFLERSLGLAPPPEELDVLGGLDPQLVGTTVHEAVERLARVALAGATGGVIRWPADPARWIEPIATRRAREHGVPLVARALAARAGTYLALLARLPELERARVLAAEDRGAATLATGEVPFRADLVLAGQIGERLIDLKVAAPPAAGWVEAPGGLLAAVRAGARLQVPLYTLAARAEVGTYLFLGHPERAELDPRRVASIDGSRADVTLALEEVVATVAAVWRAGHAVPRLVDASLEAEGPGCRTCVVAVACHRGDSSVRGRLVEWLELGGNDARSQGPLGRLMRLGGRP